MKEGSSTTSFEEASTRSLCWHLMGSHLTSLSDALLAPNPEVAGDSIGLELVATGQPYRLHSRHRTSCSCPSEHAPEL